MNEKRLYKIKTPARHRVRIQRSTFVGSVDFVTDRNEAETFIEKVKREFYNATHNCFAYRIDQNEFRFSDDGEPSGTAGKPILMALDKYNLEKTALVVTRYFGGTRLGRGGLIRVYSQCAEETIQKAGLKEIVPLQHLKLNYPYSFNNNIQSLINKYSGKIVSSDYKSEVSIEVHVPKKYHNRFLDDILNLGSNEIHIIER